MQLILFIAFLLMSFPAWATTYYVRTDGSNSTNCNGQADAAYDGSGTGEACAFNHPFWYTGWCGDYPSSCTSGVAGTSDDLVVVNGSYDVGYDASWSGCNGAFKYGCNMKPLPDGTSGNHSSIKGCTTSGCANNADRPTFYTAEGEKFALNLASSDYVDVQDIRLTEDRDCGKGHPTKSCTNPDNDGVYIQDATNITFVDVQIDGNSRYGVFGGPTSNISFTGSDISYNSYGGVIGDTTGSCTTCGWGGTLTFNNTNILGNGCIEDNAAFGTIVADGCYSQSQSGYGDGIGMGNTGGDWIFTDVHFGWNASDNLDLLYHNRGSYSGGTISLKRVRSEGATGDAVKGSNAMTIEDSYIIANCGYFYGHSTTCDSGTCGAEFDYCRSNTGSAIKMEFHSDVSPKIINNTVLGNGDVLIITSANCTSGTDVLAYNNIFIGGKQWNDDNENPTVGTGGDDNVSIFYNTDGTCAADFVEDYNICINNFKEGSPCPGAHSVDGVSASDVFSGTILQGPFSSPGYYTDQDYISILALKSGSTAIDFADESVSGADDLDYDSVDRDPSWDAGALEYDSGGGIIPPTNSKWYGKLIGSIK